MQRLIDASVPKHDTRGLVSRLFAPIRLDLVGSDLDTSICIYTHGSGGTHQHLEGRVIRRPSVNWGCPAGQPSDPRMCRRNWWNPSPRWWRPIDCWHPCSSQTLSSSLTEQISVCVGLFGNLIYLVYRFG